MIKTRNLHLVPLCDLFNTDTGFVAELQNKSRENPVFTWRDWHSFHLFEETKNQLDALTSDIKGNANVVRTKLKCEWNCPFFGTCGRLKLFAVFWFFYDITTLFQQPWSKACPKTTQQTGAPLTSGFRKHRSASAERTTRTRPTHLQNESGFCSVRSQINKPCSFKSPNCSFAK